MFIVLTMLNGLAVVGLFLGCAGVGTALFTQLGVTDSLHYPSAGLTMAVGVASAALLWAGRTVTAVASADAD